MSNRTGTPVQPPPPPPTRRAPGSFSPMPNNPTATSSSSTRPAIRRVESSSDEENTSIAVPKARPGPAPAPPRPLYAVSAHNSSSGSLQQQQQQTQTNFSRPSLTVRSDVPRNVSASSAASAKSAKSPASSLLDASIHRHGRKHSQTQGSFEAFLPTASANTIGMGALDPKALSASQIAAQAAMQQQSQHARQRSQTVPTPQLGLDTSGNNSGNRRPSGRGPASPPLLSVTEATLPRDHSFGGQSYHNGLLGGHQSAAQTAANVVFNARSPVTSPGLPPTEYELRMQQPDRPIKAEKPKVKLFSRPGKIGISSSKDVKSTALPSPNKIGYSLGGLQRGNMSTASLADSMSSAASMYSMANSSSATIRAVDQPAEKEKEKKHHFLSRQKNKLTGKDDHHLPLSSAASNSKAIDPSAPSSLYNFNLPPSPGPTSTSFAKTMSGLDLRHGGRALREKKKEEKNERESEMNNEWPGPSSLGSAGASLYQTTTGGSSYTPSIYGADQTDLARYGLNNMTPDDAWPFLRAKLLIIFEGEDLRLPVEEFNRLVQTHLQRCIGKRAPSLIVEDLRDLLSTGFSSLDLTLRRTPDDRLIPHLVEMWLFTFTSILPYMQAVFLPLDLEFSGNGTLMTPDQAREFWGALPSSSQAPNGNASIPASQALEVRRIVLSAYRDRVILPRFENLKTIFSRLSLDSISLAIPSTDNLSTSPDSFGRPSTAMSLDPAFASYSSQSTTLMGGGSSGDGSGNRSRAISNVSYTSEPGSNGLGINMPPPPRPFTPSSTHPLRGARERNDDSGNRVTETVGRMLQCMSVLTSVGVGGGGDEASQKKMEELTRGLKLNWLGRGRTGRNRRGMVGGRVQVPAGGVMA